jgi:hypothetical protein
LAHQFAPGRSQKETAAEAALPRGGQSNVNAINIRAVEYLADRVDAIAIAVDPASVDLEELAELIDLADAALPDPDDELEPDLEPLLCGIGRCAAYDLDREVDDAERDGLENPPHLPGGNGEARR